MSRGRTALLAAVMLVAGTLLGSAVLADAVGQQAQEQRLSVDVVRPSGTYTAAPSTASIVVDHATATQADPVEVTVTARLDGSRLGTKTTTLTGDTGITLTWDLPPVDGTHTVSVRAAGPNATTVAASEYTVRDPTPTPTPTATPTPTPTPTSAPTPTPTRTASTATTTTVATTSTATTATTRTTVATTTTARTTRTTVATPPPPPPSTTTTVATTASTRTPSTATATPTPTPTPTRTTTRSPTPTSTPTPTPTPTLTATPSDDGGGENGGGDGDEVDGSSTSDAGDDVGGEYSYQDLMRGERLASGEYSPASERDFGQYGFLAWRYDPAGLFKRGSSWLTPGATINSNSLTVRAIRPVADTYEEFEVVVVAWDEATRRVDNKTVRYAANQTVTRKSINLGPDRSGAQIDLQPHFEGRQVTVWIAGYPETRVTFHHKSAKTAKKVEIDTAGDAMRFGAKNFLLPIAVVAILSAIGTSLLMKRVKAGPQRSVWFWVGGGALALGLFASASWVAFANWLYAAPWSLSAFVGLVIGGVILETQREDVVETVLFRMDTEPTRNFRGKIAKTASGAEFTRYLFTKTDDGLAFIPSGFIPLIARAFGGATIVDGNQELKSELDLTSQSDADKLIFVDERDFGESDLLEVDPETLTLDLPESRRGTVYVLASLLVPGLAVWGALAYIFPAAGTAPPINPVGGGLLAALAVFVLVWSAVDDGTAWINAAPKHSEIAYTSTIYLDKQLDDYRTEEELLKELKRKDRQSEDFKEYLRTLNEESIIEDSVSRGDPDRGQSHIQSRVQVIHPDTTEARNGPDTGERPPAPDGHDPDRAASPDEAQRAPASNGDHPPNAGGYPSGFSRGDGDRPDHAADRGDPSPDPSRPGRAAPTRSAGDVDDPLDEFEDVDDAGDRDDTMPSVFGDGTDPEASDPLDPDPDRRDPGVDEDDGPRIEHIEEVVDDEDDGDEDDEDDDSGGFLGGILGGGD